MKRKFFLACILAIVPIVLMLRFVLKVINGNLAEGGIVLFAVLLSIYRVTSKKS